MDFFASQDRALRNTGWLIGYLVLAVLGIVLAVHLTVALFITWASEGEGVAAFWSPELFVPVAAITLVVVGLGTLYKTLMLSRGGRAVAEMLGGELIDRGTLDPQTRRLLNVVDEMALAAGMPVPPVYLMAREGGINAFAAGFSPNDAVIGVTRGTVELLDRDELQGVIAHEFSHILRGDMRLNLRLIGILHGILAISMVGYVLMRTSSRRHFSSSNKKGGNPLPALGLALYVIGYVGVFFAHLIKAAISRQREFLADAAAVQFTRNPDGIAGALKKIGGLAGGSRITHPEAEEASHMFFSNGLAESWAQAFATHPPLPERIRRIDPSFDGKFERIALSASEGMQAPRAGAAQFAGGAATAALPQATAINDLVPVDLVGSTGAPTHADLAYSQALLQAVPPEVIEAVHHPVSARAVVLALLIQPKAPFRQSQWAIVEREGDAALLDALTRLEPQVVRLSPEIRLPLVELAVPALKQLSPAQFDAFCQLIERLVAADETVSLFEFALARMIVRQVGQHLGHWKPPGVRILALRSLTEPGTVLLSALARVGHASQEQMVEAFRRGAREAFGATAPLEPLPAEACRLREVDRALQTIAQATYSLRQRVLNGCAACVAFDGHLTIEEGELLRAIAETLDCPLPPITR